MVIALASMIRVVVSVVFRLAYGKKPPGTAVYITLYTWTTDVGDGLRPSSRRGHTATLFL